MIPDHDPYPELHGHWHDIAAGWSVEVRDRHKRLSRALQDDGFPEEQADYLAAQRVVAETTAYSVISTVEAAR